jgi:beta-phosphoglucomutase
LIRALCFDLDGTLLNTELLKSISYGQAIHELQPAISVDQVKADFKEVVGRTREYVSHWMVERYRLKTTWQKVAELRGRYYERMLQDHGTLRDSIYAPTMDLLETAREAFCKVSLVTMSHRPQVDIVLDALEIGEAFDVVLTREDVSEPKPDPEIYLQAATLLEVEPAECLVLEDSMPGIESALAAGMHCIAITNEFTRDEVNRSGILPPDRIVNDGALLLTCVENFYAKVNAASLGDAAAVCDIPKTLKRKIAGNC